MQVERQAKLEAERQAKLEAERQAQAASNTPQNFGASQASWRRKPNFVFPRRVERGARSGQVFNGTVQLLVDKQGNVTSATVTNSSGNRIIDRDAQQTFRRAKFNPFVKNGVPVVGRVSIPFKYVMP